MRRAKWLGILLWGVSMAAGAQEGGDGWKQRYRDATGHQLGCFGEQDDQQCRALIAGYERAMEAPDADGSVRHALFREFLHAQAVFGAILRKRGDLKGASAVLEQGYVRMMEHYDGGKHFHTLIDNLRLQSELIQVLVMADQQAAVTQLLGNAREAADAVYGSFEAAAGNEHKLRLQHSNLVASEDLESDVAATLAARAAGLRQQGKTAEAARLKEAAVVAYERATAWVRFSTAAGVQGQMDLEPAMRISELQRGLGDLLAAAGEGKAAAQAYLYAGAHSCGLLEPGAHGRVRAGEQLAPDQYLAFKECQLASHGYLVASGELQRLARDSADALYREQMSLLEVDLEPLLRQTQPVKE